jgi:hypothetical protein
VSGTICLVSETRPSPTAGALPLIGTTSTIFPSFLAYLNSFHLGRAKVNFLTRTFWTNLVVTCDVTTRCSQECLRTIFFFRLWRLSG